MHIDNRNFPKQFMLGLAIMLFITPVFGQKVRNEAGIINSKKYDGISVTIDDKQAKVSQFWQDELRKTGKVRRKRDFFQIEEFSLPNEFHPEAIYYTRIIEKDSATTRIWISLDPQTLLAGDEGVENVNFALNEYMGSIPEAYRVHTVQLQIEDAERAMDFTTRQQQKLMQDRRTLELQLDESKAERDQLKKTLENLELEILALGQKIEDNKLAVEQTYVDLEKINKMMELYREKLKKN